MAFVGGTKSTGVAYDDPTATSRGQLLVWCQASLALLVLGVAVFVHMRNAPFKYGFQNTLEVGLFGSDITVITLCLLYTVR